MIHSIQAESWLKKQDHLCD